MEVSLEIPEPEESNPDHIEDSESQAFAGLSEVHSDRAEEHADEAEDAATQATESAILALEANEQAGNSADAATMAATAVTLSNAEIADRLDALPGLLANAIAGVLNPPDDEHLVDDDGEVIPLAPDEEPMIPAKWHHKLLQGSGGIYKNGTRSIYRGR